MMGRRAVPLTVTAEDRIQLESIARSQSLPAALARRAQMILRLADGETNSAVAERYQVSRPTVSLWRKRYAEHGLSGLHNELKPGRPRSTSEDAIAELIQTALTRKPTARTHWSRRSLAEETGLSKSTVHRYLTLFGVQPHRTKSFKLSNDPFFIEKVRDIVGLYLNPPDHALVLCVDEKSQCQALERTQPVLPMGLGYVEGITHDYIRHGTTTLFAALDVANGTVLAQCKPKHRHQEFLAFLRHIEANVPEHLDVHLICGAGAVRDPVPAGDRGGDVRGEDSRAALRRERVSAAQFSTPASLLGRFDLFSGESSVLPLKATDRGSAGRGARRRRQTTLKQRNDCACHLGEFLNSERCRGR
jgi:putative transposase